MGLEKISELLDTVLRLACAGRQNSACGAGTGDQYCCVGDA